MIKIEDVLKTAKEAGASDVHLTVGIPPKMRINGKLTTMDYPALMPEDTLDVLIDVMTEAQRDIFEEKGQYDMSFSILNCGRYRVNAYRQRGSVAMAFRLVGSKIPPASELGIPDQIMELADCKKGLVLVTGPAGNGKSTTLAAIIDKINNYSESHVITLEDPIEYLHQHRMAMVNQREIGLDAETYAEALSAALREDPDVILIGELRDLETISLAVTAAETGHLVLSTLHTTGVVNTVERLIDVFPPHQQQQIRVQLADVLEAVISQQLVPSQDGGRVAVFEIMRANREIRSVIRENMLKNLPEVIAAGRKDGMVTMDDALLELYHQGKISKDTALQAARDAATMERKL